MANPLLTLAQGYVDNLMDTKHCVAMAIFERNSPVLVAASAGFPLSEASVQTLLNLSADTSVSANVPVELVLNSMSERYILVRRHDKGVMLKKGGNGMLTVCTERYCLIGLHDDKTKAEVTLTDMNRVADYLLRRGF